MQAFVHGIILAFGLILPLGVQNIFVFSQGVTQPNIYKALPATLAAALCDTLLIFLAVFGLSIIVLQFEWIRLILLISGILFLCYMGKVIWSSVGVTNLEEGRALPIKQQILFALSVSLLNPHALLDTVGVIGTSALKYKGIDQILFATASVGVSWVWFFSLTITGAYLKKLHISGKVFIVFNKLSALFIWGTAIYLLINLD
ncbi:MULTISPECIES: LysE/ArgO family amino acid transporter [unclassified Rummeliibacillus]|uniref:LysE/ArgO family amino acid transporter n=1 Tax=unclassified Rummeliibacillus TaxID=2622809 RepID=UPI000E661D40|nr:MULTISPECIES: LysE family transporter [unclassified Rummeliibacillus]RIJ63848.1 amino acid transporter [Rummeliibacillus sp. POC4]RPJ96741.1 amino acid transporter [Rummeliibacillus sp. TYF005]